MLGIRKHLLLLGKSKTGKEHLERLVTLVIGDF